MVIKMNFFENHFQDAAAAASSCRGILDFKTEFLIIIGCCLLGLIWAFYNMRLVQNINVQTGVTGYEDGHVGGSEISHKQKSLLI